MKGCIDNIFPNGVIGWVSADVGEYPCVEIYCNNDRIGFCVANRERPDLSKSGRHGYGFFMKISNSFQENLGCYSVFIDGNFWTTLVAFQDRFCSGIAEMLVGDIWESGPRFLGGWMIDHPSADRSLDIVVDGEFVGRVKANSPQLKIEEEFGVANTAFLWPFPKRYKDGKPHTYSAYRRSDGRPFHGENRLVVPGGSLLDIDTSSVGLLVTLHSPFHVAVSHLELWSGDYRMGHFPLFIYSVDDAYVGSVIIPWGEVIVGVATQMEVCVPEYSVQAPIPRELVTARLGELKGCIDVLDSDRYYLAGWIAYTDEPALTVPVEVIVDGEHVASDKASHARVDLRNVGFTEIHHGFQIPLPEALFTDVKRTVSVRCALTGKSLGKKQFHFKASPRHRHISLPDRPRLWSLTRLPPRPASHLVGNKPIVTIIILTRDGAPVLKWCLESIAHFVDLRLAKIVVVDHDSHDETPSVIDRFTGKMNIIYLRYATNNSFSHANNKVAFEADTPFVIFLNNDIILASNAVESLLNTLLADESIGAVGCKLIEAREKFDTSTAKIHHAGIALDLMADGIVRACEIGEEISLSEANRPIEVYGVTGACLAMRTEEFRSLGGFPEIYFYGGEDVDLSVKVHTRLRKRIICRNDVLALHYRGYARLTERGGAAISSHLIENQRRLFKRLGYYNRKLYQQSVLTGSNNVSLHRGVIGFVVIETGKFARSGEYFTAAELAAEYEALTGCSTVFITPDTDWYDVSGLDCLVVMLHDYDITQIHSRQPNMLLVAWARNHFDHYLLDPAALDAFDLILSSSSTFVEELRNKRGQAIQELKIGTRGFEMASGIACDQFKADIIFNGNIVGNNRSFGEAVDPTRFNGSLRIIGSGWENHDNLKDYWCGAVNYDTMPDVYASAQIVIDDANLSARAWGGTNSRVFDALAAGCLVITNSEQTSRTDFDGLLPVWHDMDELYRIVNHYLADRKACRQLVDTLRAYVLERHTYRHRAITFRNHLIAASRPTRIAIKIAAPTAEVSEVWGDFYFAGAIAKQLRKRGYRVRIDCLDRWNDRQEHNDVALVLRGLAPYTLQDDQINMIWVISHPDMVSSDELKEYDHIFCASEYFSKKLVDIKNKTVLRQFSEFEEVYGFDGFDKNTCHEVENIVSRIGCNDIIFIGNTRGVRRDFVLDIHRQHGVKFIGQGWKSYVSDSDILAEKVHNAALPILYRLAGCVLNDHWPDMASNGIVSNRIFDVMASGGVVFSDYVQEGVDVFGNDYFCSSSKDFSERWARVQADPAYRERLISHGQSLVTHSVDNRVEVIHQAIQNVHAQRMLKGVHG